VKKNKSQAFKNKIAKKILGLKMKCEIAIKVSDLFLSLTKFCIPNMSAIRSPSNSRDQILKKALQSI
jgi:hypothetical protein